MKKFCFSNISLQEAICMWLALPTPATYAHYGKEQFSLSMDNSINNLVYYCKMLMSLLLLRLVSEACQMSTSAWVSIECHWFACTGSHIAGNHHTTGWWYRPWIYLYFMTVWVQCGLLVGYFTFKITEPSCYLPLRGSPAPSPSTLYRCLWCW